LTYLVEQHAAPIVSGNPHLSEVMVVPRTRGVSRLIDDARLAMRLRARRFDVVIDLHGGPRSSWLTWATGATHRIGYDIQGRGWHYTRTVHRPRGLQPRHSVANQWELLAAVPGWTGAPPDPASYPAEMALDPAVDARIAERLSAAGIDRSALNTRRKVIVIHVSAGNPFRRWPEEAFASVTVGLAAVDEHRRIILSSGPSDRLAADRIARSARHQLGSERAGQVVDFGDIDLAELRALVERSALFIGGDSGPLHVASTTTTPVVGIYGPTLSVRSKPWRDPVIATESVEIGDLPCRPCDQRVCEPGDFRCLTHIEPAAVLAAAERTLAPVPAKIRLHS
jgi:ADP-heptose:LPS heptosyltransferase